MTRTLVVLSSQNTKTGATASTYRTQDTCPPSCALLANGCYAQGRIFSLPSRYGKEGCEAVKALRHQLPRDGWLRLNVSGDFLDDAGALDQEYVEACNYVATRRRDVRILAYTHAWRDLTPDVFSFTVNASCETPADVEAALAAGWQVALADTGEKDSLIGRQIGGRNVIRCPQETRGVQCVRCGACGADTRTRPVIAFVAHGIREKAARAAVRQARGEENGMAKVNITTNEGVLVDQIDADEWDLTKPIARAAFHVEVDEAVNRAKELESK